ncbi:MAG: tRNA (5-methylaminomethyl-2-thiouridine)(34)-methyltransferase MnmD [Bacteroidetes bacterium]|nr:tRNA (5-methylaminomethyl-2-thiouridine)(34)-methyltransferase MnmD [Bacteroidota bacterium]
MKIVQTADGSDTLFLPELNEHYHSTFGAIHESRYIFIEHAFKAIEPDKVPVFIFEVGFGTGLNALLTDLTAKALRREVRYTAIEKYPLEKEVWGQLNYPQLAQKQDSSKEFRKIHESPWGVPAEIDDGFILTKIRADILKPIQLKEDFNIIYFDAFGPDVQPDLWSEEIFQNMNRLLEPGGIFITYSCKGEVKRNLKAAGFEIEKLPGPPGKREILRARKS